MLISSLMTERIIKDSAGKPVELEEGETAITTGAYIIIPDHYHPKRRFRLLEELLDPHGDDSIYDKSSVRIIPGGKNGRVTVVANEKT